MSASQHQHEQLRELLSAARWDEAQALWLELAEQHSTQLEFLLLLVKEFADAGQPSLAADLASLIAPNLESAGKHHEWLYALKLQAQAHPKDKPLRAELVRAYQKIYETDPRLRAILAVAELDQPPTPLTTAIVRADALLALSVGAFCQHKSWGLGRIKTFDATLNRVVVAFTHNPDHAMQLAYAAESLTPLNADHIEVRKLTDLAALQSLATNEPLALLRGVLASYNHAATAERVELVLSGSVIASADWKRWWETVRKLAKRDPHFEWPAKKTDPIVFRTAPVSQQDELLEALRNAPSLGQKITATRQFLKIIEEIADPELLLQEFQDALIEAIRRARPNQQTEQLEAALLLDELRAHQRTPSETTAQLLNEIVSRLSDIPQALEALAAPVQKRAVAALKASRPDQLLNHLNEFPARLLDDMADLLPRAADRIAHHVRNQTASTELLCWICRNVSSPAWLQPLQNDVLLLAVLNAMESASTKAKNRLRDVLFNEDTLLTDLLADADTDTIRNIARRLLNSPALDELDRRSLMARLVKEFPFVQEFLVTKTVKEQPLIVSRASYERRKAELDDIVKNKIPQNSKEIALARSYGDLRENFEYKAAKDMQKLLMRRRAELEILLARAQPTEFADAKTDAVQIGTSVTVTDLATNEQHTYHILGAWDSDPARGIISYPAALAQSLLNKKVGDTIEAIGETGTRQLRVDGVEKTPASILQSL